MSILIGSSESYSGTKIPRPHGRAGSIPALGTIYPLQCNLVDVEGSVPNIPNRTGLRLDYELHPCNYKLNPIICLTGWSSTIQFCSRQN